MFSVAANVLAEIDMAHWRLDSGYTMLGVKALEKWYRQSSDATLEELVNTLRRMKRHKTVDKIYRRLDAGSMVPPRSPSRAVSARRSTTAP